jgi:hypothetical protein
MKRNRDWTAPAQEQHRNQTIHYVGRVKVDGSETTKEAIARPKYRMIIAGFRRKDRGREKKAPGEDRRCLLALDGRCGVLAGLSPMARTATLRFGPVHVHAVRQTREIPVRRKVGLVIVLNATLLGSSCGGSNGAAAGGTTLATRWHSDGARPMWKSAPSDPQGARQRTHPTSTSAV